MFSSELQERPRLSKDSRMVAYNFIHGIYLTTTVNPGSCRVPSRHVASNIASDWWIFYLGDQVWATRVSCERSISYA